MKHRPSSLPMLSLCAQFQSGEAKDYTNQGTKRHAALAALLNGTTVLWSALGLDEADRAAVEWAADYIRTHAPTSDYPLVVEEKAQWIGAEFETRYGTMDASCGSHLFDFKWRKRDYLAQMADYSLALLDKGYDTVTAHVLYGESQTAEVHTFDRESAEGIVIPILERAGIADPTPCDYCGWCSKVLTCPAVTKPVQSVASGYSEVPEIKSWHPSEMQTGKEFAAALKVWRTVVKKWGESLEFHALEAATKKGLTMPGFEVATKKGRSFVPNVPEAFPLSGLPQDEFLKCCELRLNTSKKFPDKVGIVDTYKKFHGITATAAAKRDILKKLGEQVKTAPSSTYLKAVNETEETEE